MKNIYSLICMLGFFISTTHAQNAIPDFYKGPGLDSNRSYVNQNFSEYIDPFNGSMQLHYVDINVPGNGGFDIQVTRSYNSAGVDEFTPQKYFGSAGVGWSVHFGRILFMPRIGPCAGALAGDVLFNPVLELPDGSTQVLAYSSGGTSPTFVSTRRWRADCPSTFGLTVYSPDGIRYDMTQLVSGATELNAYYTTKITDRNNNTANIVYAGALSPEVSYISTNDGRRIDFTYFPLTSGELTRRISTIISRDNSGDHTYTYGYQTVNSNLPGAYNLTSVTRPDGNKWQYSYYGNRYTTVPIPGSYLLSGVTYPEAGTINYSYGTATSDYVNFDVYNTSSNVVLQTALKTKTTSDGGNWLFSYSPGRIGNYDTTTASTPSGTITYTHVGPNYATAGSLWMVGLLIQKQFGSQTETYNWIPQVISSQQFRRPGQWATTRYDNNTSAPILSSKTIARDGVTHTTSFGGFDSYGNPSVVTESGPNGGSRTTSLTYYQNTSLWILRQVQNQNVSGGVQISRNFDGLGNLLNITQDGVATSYSRYGDGSVYQATFPRGLTHTYSNYRRGIPQTERQPEGISLSRTVSDSGNVLSETNGRGYTTSYGYDGLNRVTQITPAQGNATTIIYGQASKSATRGGSLTETTLYDGFGRPWSVTLGGVLRTYLHDTLGRTTFISNPGAAVGTNYQYDILNRVTYVANADGSNRAIGFGAASKTVRDERGYSTTYNFRAYGDPDQQFLMSVNNLQDSSANIVLGRSTRDLVTSFSQGGFVRTYGYDSRGYLTSVINPETGTTIYGRDDANNMVSRAVGTSGTTTFGYDGQNRLTSESYPGGTPSVIKTYTNTNKLATVTSSVATRSYGYDNNDNLTGESLTIDGLGFGLTYGYNGNDQLSSLTYPRSGRVVGYAPDALGRPTQVSGFVNSVGYWASGQISQITYANGTTSTYGQNSRLWPSYFQTTKGASGYLSSSYGYDGLGNLTSIADSVDSSYNRTLGYDALNRLSSASGPWGSGTLTYDGTGNLRSQTFGSSNLSYAYSAGNLLSSVSGSRTATYSYDAYGDIVGTGSKTFSYDGAPNMTCANCNDAATNTQYQYDGLNQRVSTLKAGVKTYEFYGFNGSLLTELTPSLSNRLAEYIYLGGKRVATVGPAPTAISLPAQSLTAVAGKAVTFTATLGGGASPTGTVSFYDGSTLLGTVNVVSGKASLTTTFQTLGAHTFNANYNGDAANFGSSTSATVTVLSSTTITGPAGGPSLKVVAGKPTALGVTINGNSPTGTVSFYDGSTLLGTAALVSGTGSITATISTPGAHSITMVYSGDANNAPSSATVTLTVTLPPEQLIPILQLLLDD